MDLYVKAEYATLDGDSLFFEIDDYDFECIANERGYAKERTCKRLTVEKPEDYINRVLACSECGDVQSVYADFKYCPNCGAKVVE